MGAGDDPGRIADRDPHAALAIVDPCQTPGARQAIPSSVHRDTGSGAVPSGTAKRPVVRNDTVAR